MNGKWHCPNSFMIHTPEKPGQWGENTNQNVSTGGNCLSATHSSETFHSGKRVSSRAHVLPSSFIQQVHSCVAPQTWILLIDSQGNYFIKRQHVFAYVSAHDAWPSGCPGWLMIQHFFLSECSLFILLNVGLSLQMSVCALANSSTFTLLTAFIRKDFEDCVGLPPLLWHEHKDRSTSFRLNGTFLFRKTSNSQPINMCAFPSSSSHV